MKKIGHLALACCALFSFPHVKAASLPADQLERAIFLSMMLSQDSEKSRMGVRILGQRFPNDDSVCDHIAERLLKASDPASRVAVDTIAWYVTTIRESCSSRYRNALTLARQRYTNEKITKHLDEALAIPVTSPVEQYAEGGVDLAARDAELQKLLSSIGNSSKTAGGIEPGATFGEVVQRAGVPQELTSMTLRVARYGRQSALVAHYSGSGLLMFRRAAGDQWTLVDSFAELFPVSETYKGTQFGIAQSLACLRGETFRVYLKTHAREIRQDPGLMWALTHRLIATPFPADDFEEDGMLVAVKLIASSRHAESLDMLKQIGAAPGEDVPEAARDYARKLARQAATPQVANQ